MANDAINMRITDGDVVVANSHKEARNMFFDKNRYKIEFWEEDHEGTKFDSLEGDEKESAIIDMFRDDMIFEIEPSKIEGLGA